MPRKRYFVACSVPGCPRPMIARGWCRTHYGRWHRTGAAELTPPPSPAERFWARVDKNGPVHPTLGRCWIWTGGKFRDGYGAFHVSGKLVKAPRFSWELHNGPIPTGLLALHRCDNPPCVNPDHLFLGTEADNAADRDRKGRQMKGEAQHLAKLNPQKVRKIRRRYVKDSPTDGSTALAREFGVRHITILRVVKHQCWKHVSP